MKQFGEFPSPSEIKQDIFTFIEDDVVGETGVVSPSNGVTLGDGNSGRVEGQGTCREYK
jgi:hypothetical protein